MGPLCHIVKSRPLQIKKKKLLGSQWNVCDIHRRTEEKYCRIFCIKMQKTDTPQRKFEILCYKKEHHEGLKEQFACIKQIIFLYSEYHGS